jgi:hypothetical protein
VHFSLTNLNLKQVSWNHIKAPPVIIPLIYNDDELHILGLCSNKHRNKCNIIVTSNQESKSSNQAGLINLDVIDL